MKQIGDEWMLSEGCGRLGGDSDESGIDELRWRAWTMFAINSDAGVSVTSGILKARYRR